MRTIGAYNTIGTEAAPSLAENVFAQEFTAPLDNLNKVEIMFEIPPQEYPQALQIKIKDIETNQIVRQAEEVAEVGVMDSFIEFEFEPIVDSQHKKYQLIIGPETLDSQETQVLIIIDQPIQLKYTSDNYYQQGELYINGQPTQSDLVFRTFHQIDTSYSNFVFQSLLDKISADPVFFSIWIVLIFLTLTGVLAGLISSFKNK